MNKNFAILSVLCLSASVVSAQEKGLDSPRDRHLDRRSAEQGRIVAAKAATPRFLGEWGKEGSEPGEFHFPIDIVVNADDQVFVIDS